MEAVRVFKYFLTIIEKHTAHEEISDDIALLLETTGSMTPYSKHAISIIDNLLSGNSSILAMLTPMLPDSTIQIRCGFWRTNMLPTIIPNLRIVRT